MCRYVAESDEWNGRESEESEEEALQENIKNTRIYTRGVYQPERISKTHVYLTQFENHIKKEKSLAEHKLIKYLRVKRSFPNVIRLFVIRPK